MPCSKYPLPYLFCLFFGLLFLGISGPTAAQEPEQVYVSDKQYLDLNIHALDNYARRLERTQKLLLADLKRRERRLERRLMHRDSAVYARYEAANTISYDSIARCPILHPTVLLWLPVPDVPVTRH